MSAVRLVLVFLSLMAAASAATGQDTTGVVSGVVTGDDGTRLPGATVTVESQTTGVRGTATTDEDGRYTIRDVPLDRNVVVRVALAGFATSAVENVTFDSGRRATVDVVLKITLIQSLTVTARSPLLEEDQSTVQQTVNEELVHSVPLVSRNFLSLAALAAGFTGNENFPSPQGQTFWTNNVLVDGGSHFSKWRSAPRAFYAGYGLESIKQVRVLTNRFSAEYGDALATVTTALTKSGSDEYRGSALFYVQNSALNAPPEFAPVKPPSSTERYGFTFGGPLTRSREVTHFLESYEGRRSRGNNIVVSPAAAGQSVRDNEDEHLIFFRVDHRPNPNHLMMSRYNGQFLRAHNEPGGLNLPGSGTSLTNDAHTWLTTDRRSIGTRWLNDARFQFARFVDFRRDLQPTVLISRAGYSLAGGSVGPVGFGANPEDTWEAADTVSYVSPKHALRIGGGVKHVRAHNPSLNYGHGAYFFAGAPDQFSSPFQFVQGFALTPEAPFADPRSTSAFGFVQEDVRIDSAITLNLGVRYDVDHVGNVRNYTASTDLNNVQPRLGIAWRPAERTVVRGGFGLYTQQHLLYYINRVQLEGPDGTVVVSLPAGSPFFPAFPNALPILPPGASYPPRDIQVLDRDFRNPYSLQSTIGVQRTLEGVTIGADYVYLQGRDLMSLVDSNAPAPLQKPNQRTVAQADATRPLPPLPGLFRNIVMLGNQGRSWYRALQVKAERSTGRLLTMASYTLGHGEDMLNYELPEDSRNLAAERGRSNADVRHNLTVGASWTVPGTGPIWRDWALSGIGVFRSNRPYTIVWGDDRNGTTQNDARPDGRNTGKTDAYQNVDLALTRRFTRGVRTFEARAEMFNVLNTVNYDQYVGALLSPFYAKPVSAFPKRRMQFAGTIRF
jgi:hypothetical protein